MKHTILAVISLAGLALQAQSPTLTSSSAPQLGDQFTIQAVDTPTTGIGSGGANQVWDFSSIVDNGALSHLRVVSPSATPYASHFPGATIALTDPTTTDSSYIYESVTSARTTFLGNDYAMAGEVQFTTPRVLFQYPLAYGDSYTNNFGGTSSQGDTTYGVDAVTADGYGTLKLPGHTYTNVLRLKYTQHTHTDNSSFGYSSLIDQVEYDYYIPSYHYYLFSIAYATNTIGTITVQGVGASYSKSTTTGISDLSADATVSLFPNPSTGIFTLNNMGQNLVGKNLSVVNIMGQTIHEETIHSDKQSIDLSSAAKGIYIVVINDGSKTISKRLIIE